MSQEQPNELLNLDRCFKWNPWTRVDPNDTYSGVAFEIYNGMKQSWNIDYKVNVVDNYGVIGEDNKFSGLFGSMPRNETDVLGPVFMSESRALVVNYAPPFFMTQLVVLSGLVNAETRHFMIFRIFSWKVWLALFLSTFIGAAIATLIYVVLSSSSRKEKVLVVFWESLWAFGTSVLEQDFGANLNRILRPIWEISSFRFLQIMWFIVCLVFINTYRGKIVSTYTAEKMKPKIASFDDLLQDTHINVGTFPKSYPLMCLSKLQRTKYESIYLRSLKNPMEYVPAGSGKIPKWLDEIEAGTFIQISEIVYSKNIIGERFKRTGKCNIHITAIDLCSTYLALAFRKTFPTALFGKFSDKILKFNEAGLVNRAMMGTTMYYDICTQMTYNIKEPLGISDLIGAFTILGLGLALAVAQLFLEITVYKHCKQRNSETVVHPQ